ncbi:MAG TPA: O-antigen ligase family protein, partial [Candidatus Limnocylindria bacterium]|nr:O-antigen ligase family protein [Candidatus Limnocylindria bacterium]
AISPDLGDAYYDFVVSLQSEERVESWDPVSESGAGSVGIRFVALSAAVEIMGRNPLLGVGPGEFEEAFAEVRPDARVPNLQSAHNFLPNLAAEYGLPMLLLVVVAFAVAVLLALPWLDSPDRLARVAAMGVAIAIIAWNAFAAFFGVDLYRTFRLMNADVLQIAVLTALGISLVLARRETRTADESAADGVARV